jgi:hypothetical protein
MFYSIPGNGQYKISLDGKVINGDGSACTLPITNNKIYITMYGIERLLDLDWLGLVSFYQVNLPSEQIYKLWSLRFTPASQRVLGSINNKVMVFKIPVIVNEGFRVIPGFTKYAIDNTGKVIEIATSRIIPTRIPKLTDGRKSKHYPTVDIDCISKQKNIAAGVHRLLALAWKTNIDYVNRCVINHLDGDKFNNRPFNLEWVTYSENSDHAFETGLRTDNIPCKVRDIKTKLVTEFATIGNACKFMGLRRDSSYETLFPKRQAKLINNRFELKLQDDMTPWVYENIDKPLVAGRYEITVTKDDGEIETYYDIRSAVKAYRPMPNGIPNDAQLVADHIRKLPDIVSVVLKDTYQTEVVQAYEVKTGNSIEASHPVRLAKLLNIDRSSVKSALEAGETRVCKGYAFRYKNDLPWNTNFTVFESSPRCILAADLETKAELKFTSLREAAKHFGVDRATIKKRLNSDINFRGWKLKEI